MNFGEDLSLQVMQVNKSYYQFLFKTLGEIDIYQHYQILLLISRTGGRTTQKHICDAMQIEKSNMVAIITLLGCKGYVTKEVNYKDKRGRLISLTIKSKQLIMALNQLFAILENEIADDVTWQEMHNCIRVLNKINYRLKNMTIPDLELENIDDHKVLMLDTTF